MPMRLLERQLTLSAVYGFEDLERGYSITADKLTSWNTWLSSDCDTKLCKGMSDEDVHPMCIGVNASAPAGTATAAPATHTAPSKTSGSVIIGLTESGEVAGCAKHYTGTSDFWDLSRRRLIVGRFSLSSIKRHLQQSGSSLFRQI